MTSRYNYYYRGTCQTRARHLPRNAIIIFNSFTINNFFWKINIELFWIANLSPENIKTFILLEQSRFYANLLTKLYVNCKKKLTEHKYIYLHIFIAVRRIIFKKESWNVGRNLPRAATRSNPQKRVQSEY